MPLPAKKKAKIVLYLQEGSLSKRAIAREVGTTRTTVDRIEKELLFPEKKPTPPKLIKPPTEGPIQWIECPGCHKKVEVDTPCLTCYTRQKQMADYDTFMKSLIG